MFACFYIPDFPVQASLLPEPAETRTSLQRMPLAILDGPANLPRVFATNAAARRAGIQPGMTKLQVETYGGVLLRKRSIASEESAQTALVGYAAVFSPRVESTSSGTVILDLAGMEKILGPWQSATHAMTMQALEIGFDLRIAIASNPDTALLAARGFSVDEWSAPTIISAGDEARCLASLRVNVLPISPEVLEVFNGWGIRTFQSLAALPTVALVERLGQEGLYLQKLVLGESIRPLRTSEPYADFVESFEFDDPVETLESLFFILNRILHELCVKLLASALAAQELRLKVELKVRQLQRGEEKEQYQHEWKLPVPTQDKNLLFGLVRLQLEKITFSAPVRKLTLEVVPVKPRVAQGNLFAPPSPEAEKLEITLERIRGVVGSSDANGIACVGSPCLVDTHQPGSFTVQPFTSIQDSTTSFTPVAPAVALRVFRPALETSVELKGEIPHSVGLWHRSRRVLVAYGPWSSSGNWWNASAWTREEWDVVLQIPDGVGVYRIYRDRIRERWFVEGVFD
jgi:protein ImuB